MGEKEKKIRDKVKKTKEKRQPVKGEKFSGEIKDEMVKKRVREKVKNSSIGKGSPARGLMIQEQAVKMIEEGEASTVEEAVKKAKEKMKK